MAERVTLPSRRQLLKHFAPQYREASSAQKRVLLDPFAQATGSHRGSGRWLLTHAEDVLQAPRYKRASHYGPEVQQALLLLWNAANRICAKRLLPFLPTLMEALERHEHLHISAEYRNQLLSMSASLSRSAPAFPAHTRSAWPLHHTSGNAAQTADSDSSLRGVEADPTQLDFQRNGRAHCGTDIEAGSLYTLPTHRRGNRMDGMSSPPLWESGNGAGSHSTSANTVPLSDPLD
jgi:hypothetical protein